MLDKKKKSSLLLTLGTAGALVAGGGAAWFLTQRNIGPGDLPVGAEAIPQDALMTLSVTTAPEQWQKLREFGTPQSQAAFDQNLADLRDRLLTANGLDYARDIQPWVGKEVSMAILSLQPANPSPSPSPGAAPLTSQETAAVVVLPIQDPLKAKEILEKPRPTAGKLVDRTYQGFQIKETQGAARNYSVTALDGKFLVVTTDARAMNRAIDTYKGQPSLAKTPGFAQALGKVKTGQPFGSFYINFPAAMNFTSAISGRPIPPQSQSQIQQSQGVAFTAGLQSDGVLFKGVSWLKPDSQRTHKVSNNAKIMPSLLPSETIMMASDGNLKQLWQDYSQGASATSLVLPISPDGLRNGLKSTIGMDLDKDFISWMEGEFSLAMVAAPQGKAPTIPFSILFMVKTNDRRAAEQSLKQLDQAVASKYKFKVEESKVGDQPVTNWALPIGGPTISHGWLPGDVAFLMMGAPIANTILPKPANPLADNQAFKATIPNQPNPRNGHFFVNLEAATNAKLPLLQLPPGNQELVAAVKSIGVTAAISDERSTRYDILVLLQKGNKPNPLPSPKQPAGGNNPPLPSPTPSP